jgi:carboxyl-terminal processing protease
MSHSFQRLAKLTSMKNTPLAKASFWSLLLFSSVFVLHSAHADARVNRALDCTAIPKLIQTFLFHHVEVKKPSLAIQIRTIDTFLKRLDPQKTLFLTKEFNASKKSLRNVFVKMLEGDCSSIDQLRPMVIAKNEANEQFVKNYVGSASYKLDKTTSLVTDPDKRKRPNTDTQLKTFLKKYLHFQIATYVTSGEKMATAKKNLIHRYELLTKRAKELTKVKLYEDFLQSFALSLDPHSQYFTNDQWEDFKISMKLSLEGIGVLLTSRDGYVTVEEIIPGGAADQAGALEPKDKIIAVAQSGKPPKSVIDWDLSDVVRLIRGKKGTNVTLSVLRQVDKTKRFDVTITRDKIDLSDQAARIEYKTRKVGTKTHKIGVITLPSFYGSKQGEVRSCYTDVKKLIQEAKSKKVDGIVLDLSSNGGGLLDEAVNITGLFIRSGSVVAVKHTQRSTEILNDEDDTVFWDGPLAVLTSRLSASASEILAGALKAYDRALIIGDDHTFGKGSVQAVNPLYGDLGAIKVTTGLFYLPDGQSTQWQGVNADIKVPSQYSTDEIGEKNLDFSLKAQKIETFVSSEANVAKGKPGHWAKVTPSLRRQLRVKSIARVKKGKKFKEIKDKLAKAERNKNRLELAEFMGEQKELNAENEKNKTKTRSERQKELWLPQTEEAINIMSDWISLG